MPILFSLGTDHAHYDWMTQDGAYIPIDYQKAYDNGSRFTILKVVNGSVIQEHSVDELTRANASPLCAMPYMWPYPIKYISAVSQAAAWYSVMKNFPGMRIALDAEPTPGYPNPTGADHEACIREYWKLDPGQEFLEYSTEDYFAANGFNTPFFANIPRWLATRNNNPPTVAWKIYQPPYGSLDQPPPGSLPKDWGVNNGKLKVDIDYFNGNENELAIFFGSEIIPQPPEEHMYKVTVTWSAGCTQRPQPYYPSSPTGGVLPLGTVVFSDSEEVLDSSGNKWILLANGWYIATVYGGSPRVTIVPITEPPVGGDISLTMVFDDTGETYKGTLTKQV